MAGDLKFSPKQAGSGYGAIAGSGSIQIVKDGVSLAEFDSAGKLIGGSLFDVVEDIVAIVRESCGGG